MRARGRSWPCRQLGIDQVFVSHANADHILPENLHRVLGANSLTMLGKARGGRVVRIDDQQVLLVPHHRPKAAPLEWSDCTPPARAEFFGAFFIRLSFASTFSAVVLNILRAMLPDLGGPRPSCCTGGTLLRAFARRFAR